MAERRIFAGPAVRKLRREAGMTQAAMADALDISPSYLNLIESGQRPLTATVMVRLAERFDFDVAALGGEEVRSEEHTSELQPLMRISYAGFCLKTQNDNIITPEDINIDTLITYDTHHEKMTH